MTQKLAMFFDASVTQAFLIFWSLNFALGNYRAWKYRAWTFVDMAKGFETFLVTLVVLFVAWFAKNSPAFVDPGTLAMVSAAEVASLSGLVAAVGKNVALIRGQDGPRGYFCDLQRGPGKVLSAPDPEEGVVRPPER